MKPATGLQIAFLALSVEFFATLAMQPVSRANGWSDPQADVAAQSLAFAVGAAVLFGIGTLRRQCLSALRRPVPRAMKGELIAVAIAKCATPLAVMGAMVLLAFWGGDPRDIVHLARSPDPAAMWDSTFSFTGMVRMVLLGWIVGPVMEELVFRGYLYHAWERQWGWLPSLLLTSACFGLAHPTHITSAFLGSVIYICLLRRSGTLVAPIVVHVLYNVLVSWPLLGQVDIPAGTSDDLLTWWPALSGLAFVSLALPAYLWMARDGGRAAGAFAAPSRL
jgi:membrane protease YdiL (CAAX protease family)